MKQGDDLYETVMKTVDPKPGYHIEGIVVHTVWCPDYEADDTHEVESLIWPHDSVLAVYLLLKVIGTASDQVHQIFMKAGETGEWEGEEDQ